MVNPVDEGIFSLCIIFLVLGIIGPDILFTKSFINDVEYWFLFYIFFVTVSGLFLLASLWEILKVRSFFNFILDMGLMLILTGVCLFGFLFDENIFFMNEKLIIYIWATNASRLIIQLIVCHIYDAKIRRTYFDTIFSIFYLSIFIAISMIFKELIVTD